MANTSKQANSRPLSPHLSIWKWGPAMLVSILHRVTGDGMAIVGGIVLVWWLYAISAGPDAYATFVNCATSIPGYIVLVGLSWAFFQHMLSGLRHFVLDTGAGYELDTNNRWSAFLPVLGILLTGAFWAIMLVGRV
ncbi:succinate dehydrogenase, cytochrome b556 subunit [Sphingorhabdus sp. Alg239-R122]|uniref:succinate dehydrogenase, cytochrome b556 subunit n=1 Tax=Sphingorhabdus sp. Alg239-R122 TaxID=2305989 RepID=UPI0013DBC37D|nr:succinate dehydrogenase, cytochrome b556 subunit [Sphingorhabdus sp. Alg239-R122]